MEDTETYLSRLSEELSLRESSRQTEKSYVSIIRNLVESGLQPREFLLRYARKAGQV